MLTGRILNIQHFCIHDGPGIRTTVFLKGCPLTCLWCSNPNMQKFEKELVYAQSKCVGCGSCIPACPNDCLTMTPDGILVDRVACALCGKCTQVCPSLALHLDGTDMSVEDVFDEIDKDRLFYNNSGGGVTLSGGEALSQKDFAVALLKQCKESGIHTALETSACVSFSNFKEVTQYVDHLFIDIKHCDSEKHKQVTNIDNRIILGNIEKIQAVHRNVHIRIPVIPTVNDTVEEIEAIALFIQKLHGVVDVELLQYHDFGSVKYQQLGREYPFQDVPKYDLAHLTELVGHVRALCPGHTIICQAS